MINETTTGANDGKGKAIKTFPEAYEIDVFKMVTANLECTPSDDYIVKNLGKLIFDIMEFYEQKGIKR